ncbi:hypothetical protein BaRGS_00002837, partial [Batillaria attramentaria]
QAESVSKVSQRDGEGSGTGQSASDRKPDLSSSLSTSGGGTTAHRALFGEDRDGATTTTYSTTSTTKPAEYDRIHDIEELRQLLSGTVDFDEKRKIRNAMRLVRRNSELDLRKTECRGEQSPSVTTFKVKAMVISCGISSLSGSLTFSFCFWCSVSAFQDPQRKRTFSRLVV